ncbi:hypothetical protein FF100_05860 [Methylobacterium terricola]|uniref:Uncharacterized protein n=1 Tax=Methylobacterium terricola TaxID=2583531 RepID=A0A5C4LNV4_9HYPH|nr:hypothetical protein [Methylobacterium terricola]TNC15089.1 hypothetical protein FF100_05860 [Methylobacterium terricola]
MTVDEITTIADEILTRYLTASGYARVEVRPGYNQSDEPSLFVVAHMKPGAGVTGGKESNAANAALWLALREKGEERFPYLDFDYPDDEAFCDEALGDEDWDVEEDA